MLKLTDIRELAVPLEGNMSNAVVNFSHHTVSLVALVAESSRGQVVGFGFNSIGRFAQSGIIESRMKPRLLKAQPESLAREADGLLDPAAVLRTILKDEKPGGHGDRAGAAAAIELAAWDLNAKYLQQPAWQLVRAAVQSTSLSTSLSKTGQDRPAVATYAAGGYYYDNDQYDSDQPGGLEDELRRYQDAGFKAFKIKVGGATLAEDCRRIETAIKVAGDGQSIAVDANGRFTPGEAEQWLSALAPYNLRWYEEPCDPLDFEAIRILAGGGVLPIATGENLFSTQDVQNLLRYSGMRPDTDIFQMDAGLSYGLTEYLRMLGLLEADGHSRQQCFPHGGHLINLHIAAGLGLGGCEAYPGVFQPFGGFSPECELKDGDVLAPDSPGFGLEQQPALRPWLNRLADGVVTTS